MYKRQESGWPKIEVVRKAVSEEPVSFEPLAIVGDVPGADFALDEPAALADWIDVYKRQQDKRSAAPPAGDSGTGRAGGAQLLHR